MTVGESVVINLAARYAAAFGIVAVSNAINTAVISRDENKYSVDVYEDLDPAFEDVILKYKVGNDEYSLKFSAMLEGDGDGSIYAPPLMISFSRPKNLIETSISGGDGVVIERWGTKPWGIDIKGVLIDVENRTYPTTKIKQLNDFFEQNTVISAVGLQFSDKNIDSIYLKDISITPIEGFQDTIQFSIQASSIKEVSYTLLKPNE
ncbi:DUF6046 domain-containing protein [Chryseobacterium mulctrae]|uniref:DUF6046 domain-containing protein n=1 Tax=Chryseobacterium mulctrae TaxID=2576777 RepID=UPI0011179296|nr:DUF6046 domain-containing protein [Chryseobacterium mulctrae]